jgi:hypothetical protein
MPPPITQTSALVADDNGGNEGMLAVDSHIEVEAPLVIGMLGSCGAWPYPACVRLSSSMKRTASRRTCEASGGEMIDLIWPA